MTSLVTVKSKNSSKTHQRQRNKSSFNKITILIKTRYHVANPHRCVRTIPPSTRAWHSRCTVPKTQAIAMITGLVLPQRMTLLGQAVEWSPTVEYQGVTSPSTTASPWSCTTRLWSLRRSWRALFYARSLFRSWLTLPTKMGVYKTCPVTPNIKAL